VNGAALLLLGWLLGAYAQAAPGAVAARPYAPPEAVMRRMQEWAGATGLLVKAYFPGPGNLTGVAAELALGQGMIYYLSPDGRQMLVGLAVDLDTGTDLSAEAGRKYLGEAAIPQLAQPSPGAAAMSSQELLRLPSVAQGDPKAGKVLVAFVDLGCGHCHRLYEDVQALLPREGVAVHWIPMSLGSEASTTRAAAALGGQAPTLDAFWDAEPAMLLGDTGRLARGSQRLEAVMDFAESHGIRSVPTLYLVEEGAVKQAIGTPDRAGLATWMGVTP
jgi:thiol:disulfide interchange protein DsbG